MESFTCSRFELEFDPTQRTTPDGETLRTRPLTVVVLPRALQMFTL